MSVRASAGALMLWCVTGSVIGAAALRQTPPPVHSPDVSADGRITFRLRAPNATSVAVRGLDKRLTMQKDEAGVWTATTDPLPPDIYLYTFVVDGASFTDPRNVLTKTSYPTGAQSLVHVPGPVVWEPAAGTERGTVARHSYHSAIIGNDREYFVYTPPGYDRRRNRPYPVLYLLHGLTDDASAWMTVGAANVIADNLIARGQALPMVIVCPLGYGTADMLIDRPEDQGGEAMMPNFGRALMDEVVPRVERDYHVSHDRAARAIAGLSMGGAEAVFVGLNHLDTFSWVASFSGAFNMWPHADLPVTPSDPRLRAIFPHLGERSNASVRLLWLSCGSDDFLMGVHTELTDWLQARQVRFQESVVPGYGHAWPLWRRNLAELAPLLFR